jgi:hypothetical protein
LVFNYKWEHQLWIWLLSSKNNCYYNLFVCSLITFLLLRLVKMKMMTILANTVHVDERETLTWEKQDYTCLFWTLDEPDETFEDLESVVNTSAVFQLSCIWCFLIGWICVALKVHCIYHWPTLSYKVVSITSRLSGIRTHNVSGNTYWLHR